MWLKWQQREGCFRSRHTLRSILKNTLVYTACRRRSVTGLSVSCTWGEIKFSCWWLYDHALLKEQKQRGKKGQNILVRAWWRSVKHLSSAGLRCRTLLSGRHERTAVCTLLFGAGLIAGYSAVLAVRRSWVAIVASSVHSLPVCAEGAGSKTKKTNKKGKHNRSGIGPEKVFASSAIKS